jgi:hypothetical protein
MTSDPDHPEYICGTPREMKARLLSGKKLTTADRAFLVGFISGIGAAQLIAQWEVDEISDIPGVQ